MPEQIEGQCPVITPDSSEEQLMLTQQLNLISQLADELLTLANESRLLTREQGATMPAQS